jgi:hypothetical protein
MIAKLGGFLGRKSDGNPGLMVIWRGLRRLDDITETYRIFSKKPSNDSQKIKQRMNYSDCEKK